MNIFIKLHLKFLAAKPFRSDRGCDEYTATRNWNKKNVAITIGDVIVWGDKPDDEVFKHEFVHVRQSRKYGYFNFRCMYFTENILHGYKNNYFEKEAECRL